MHITSKLLATLLLLSGLSLSAQAADPVAKPIAIPQVSDQWSFSLTPYLWAVNAHGEVYYKDRPVTNQTMTTSQMLSNLQFAAMVEGEVHKGKWGFAANLLYSSLQDKSAKMVGQVDLGSKTTMDMGVYNLAATYTVLNTNNVYVDAMAGVRILSTNAKTEVNVEGTQLGTTMKANSTSTNPIVGVKGRLRISDSDYFVPFYVDVGGGVSGVQVTTQAMLGIGRAYDWGDVMLMANNLFYKTKTDNVTTNMDLYGAAVGVTFKF
jgi:hypothetical protein